MSISNVDVTTEPFRNVLCTHELRTRPSRIPDFRAENAALIKLANRMSTTPLQILDALALEALQLCTAGSAGISILDLTDATTSQFRWQALAGAWAPHLDAVMPRDHSPCGFVLERNAPQLMRNPAAYYEYVSQISPACREVLLVPFYSGLEPVGTIWVVQHHGGAHFDAEDERLLTSLAAFTSAAYEILKNLEKLEQYAQERSKEISSLAVADKSKDVFIATIAHELRNPLAPIRNTAALLRRKASLPAIVQKAAELIERQALVMSRLVEDLMDVSRVRLGKLELNCERTDIGKVLAAAIEASDAVFKSKSHQVLFEPIAAPAFVFGDPLRLEQVIENLLINAAKYTDVNGTITVRLCVTVAHAIITIKDTGVGIAQDHIASIFDLFAQASQGGTARSQGGLGVGLHLAQQLVQAHGGDLTAASNGVGCGSTFTVRLPLVS